MKPSVSAHQHSDIGDIMITIITRSMHIIIIIVATINEQIAHIFAVANFTAFKLLLRPSTCYDPFKLMKHILLVWQGQNGVSFRGKFFLQ